MGYLNFAALSRFHGKVMNPSERKSEWTPFSIIQANLPLTGDGQNPLLYVVVAVIVLAGIGFLERKSDNGSFS